MKAGGAGTRGRSLQKGTKMVAKRWVPFALTVLVLIATSTVPMAQSPNPSAPLILPNQPEVPVSPAMPSTLLSAPTMTNPLTGLPCTGGQSSLAIGGTGTPPGTNEFPDTGEEQINQLQSPSSVFGSQGTQGPC
jgi:hypothetical protein